MSVMDLTVEVEVEEEYRRKWLEAERDLLLMGINPYPSFPDNAPIIIGGL